MLNTKKMLYILPDVAYVAELLPGKKEHSFSIQSFRQINGEYLDDNEFIAENVVKLLAKIDQEEYFLVLPDFLFTNTILNVEETSDSKIKEYLHDKLLPEIGLSPDTHELETFVLTEFKGTSKVQLSAIEKEVLGPIRAAADNADIKISGIAPLSWTTKSIISLEPSISVLQIGAQLYSSQHYIGIDQTTIAEVAEAEAIAETIKTLKGAEPSIQTVYLLVNDVVEEKLKDELNDTIPLQQLADSDDEDSKMPSYVKHIIESGMKTLSIKDYPVPVFELGKVTAEEKKAFITESVEELKTDDSEEKEKPEAAAKAKTADSDAELPKPTPVTPAKEPETTEAAKEEPEDDTPKEKEEEKAAETEKEPVETTEESLEDEPEEKENSKKEQPAVEAVTTAAAASKAAAEEVTTKETLEPVAAKQESAGAAKDEDEVDLAQFAQQTEATVQKSTPEATVKAKRKKTVIKNSSGIGNMLKMVFLTLAVFAATVAIGIGVGLGLLSVANNDTTPAPTPTPTMEATPEPTPTPTPTPEPINNEDFSILVTNATTIAGYAGTVATDLEEAEFGTVTASNATEDYDPGFYVLMEEEDEALIAALEEATGLELTYLEDTDPSQEDTAGTYDAVIVLAEES